MPSLRRRSRKASSNSDSNSSTALTEASSDDFQQKLQSHISPPTSAKNSPMKTNSSSREKKIVNLEEAYTRHLNLKKMGKNYKKKSDGAYGKNASASPVTDVCTKNEYREKQVQKHESGIESSPFSCDDDKQKTGKKANMDTDKSSIDKVTMAEQPRRAMSDGAVKKDESKLKKMSVRLFFGFLMVGIFVGTMYCGHIYLCGLIFFTEVMLFRELVKVRYNTFFHIIEETIPLFRTTQWMWFALSIFHTYSDFVVEVIKSNTSLHYILNYARFLTSFSFLIYSATFVITIATMQKGYIRFQINQLCWTVLVLCLTVGQLKYIMHNVYNGFIWFALPIMLVVSNDSFAWVAGVTCGRKFINRKFISLSPNKTWEGFIGGWIGTMFFGWYLSRFMAQFTWMTCPTNSFSLFPSKLECELDPIFEPATNIFPSQIFELLPKALVQTMPGVVNICMVNGDPNGLTACVSGEATHSHHHFELVAKNVYPVQIHALGLSLFASFVAPFGGFFASAIKRAYGLKDFGKFIPGHGGMMDRMDCQLLMALCTWVHYNTFVKMATVSVPKMIYMYKLLRESDQEEFLRQIELLAKEY